MKTFLTVLIENQNEAILMKHKHKKHKTAERERENADDDNARRDANLFSQISYEKLKDVEQILPQPSQR